MRRRRRAERENKSEKSSGIWERRRIRLGKITVRKRDVRPGETRTQQLARSGDNTERITKYLRLQIV